MKPPKNRSLEELLRYVSGAISPPLFILLKLRADGYCELKGLSQSMDGLKILSEEKEKDNPVLDYVG